MGRCSPEPQAASASSETVAHSLLTLRMIRRRLGLARRLERCCGRPVRHSPLPRASAHRRGMTGQCYSLARVDQLVAVDAQDRDVAVEKVDYVQILAIVAEYHAFRQSA